jgi:uncharacterized cupin superfamily protein
VLDRSGAGVLSTAISERTALMTEEPPVGAGVTTWLVADQVWEHDEETGGQVAMLVDSPNVQAGLWKPGRSGLGPIEVELDRTEIILVLSGTGQLEVDGGAPLELTPGRAARIDVGAHTRWMVDQEFTELWLYMFETRAGLVVQAPPGPVASRRFWSASICAYTTLDSRRVSACMASMGVLPAAFLAST